MASACVSSVSTRIIARQCEDKMPNALVNGWTCPYVVTQTKGRPQDATAQRAGQLTVILTAGPLGSKLY